MQFLFFRHALVAFVRGANPRSVICAVYLSALWPVWKMSRTTLFKAVGSQKAREPPGLALLPVAVMLHRISQEKRKDKKARNFALLRSCQR